jgi:hypothetical protein
VLLDRIEAAFAAGASEITVRVSRYDNDGRTPAAYQGFVKHRDATRPWGVGVMASPGAALEQALGPEDIFG